MKTIKSKFHPQGKVSESKNSPNTMKIEDQKSSEIMDTKIVTSKKNENIEDQDHKPNRKSSRRRKESSGNEISIGDPYKNLLLNNRERKH